MGAESRVVMVVFEQHECVGCDTKGFGHFWGVVEGGGAC